MFGRLFESRESFCYNERMFLNRESIFLEKEKE